MKNISKIITIGLLNIAFLANTYGSTYGSAKELDSNSGSFSAESSYTSAKLSYSSTKSSYILEEKDIDSASFKITPFITQELYEKLQIGRYKLFPWEGSWEYQMVPLLVRGKEKDFQNSCGVAQKFVEVFSQGKVVYDSMSNKNLNSEFLGELSQATGKNIVFLTVGDGVRMYPNFFESLVIAKKDAGVEEILGGRFSDRSVKQALTRDEVNNLIEDKLTEVFAYHKGPKRLFRFVIMKKDRFEIEDNKLMENCYEIDVAESRRSALCYLIIACGTAYPVLSFLYVRILEAMYPNLKSWDLSLLVQKLGDSFGWAKEKAIDLLLDMGYKFGK